MKRTVLFVAVVVFSLSFLPVASGLTVSSISVDEGIVISGGTAQTYSDDGDALTISEADAIGAGFLDVLEPNEDLFTTWARGGNVLNTYGHNGYTDAGLNCQGADFGSLTNFINARGSDNVYATAIPGQAQGYCDGFTAFGMPGGAVASGVFARVEYKVSTTTSIATLYIGMRTGTGVNCVLQSDATEPLTDIVVVKDFSSCATWSGGDLSGASIWITMFRGASATPVTFSIDNVDIQVRITCEPNWVCLGYTTYPANDGAASFVTVNETPAYWVETLGLESGNATLWNAAAFTLTAVQIAFVAKANTTDSVPETLIIYLRNKNNTGCFNTVYRSIDSTAYVNHVIELPLFCEFVGTDGEYWRMPWTLAVAGELRIDFRWLSPYENGMSITATAVVFRFADIVYSLSIRAEWSLGKSRTPVALLIDCTEAANDENYTLATKGVTITWVCDGSESVPLTAAHLTSDFRIVLWVNDTVSDDTKSTIYIDLLDITATGEDNTGSYSWVVFLLLLTAAVCTVAYLVARIRGVV